MSDDAPEIIEFPNRGTRTGEVITVKPDAKVIGLPPEEDRLGKITQKITDTFTSNGPVDQRKLPILALEFARASLAELEQKGPDWTPEDITGIRRLEDVIHDAEVKDFLKLAQIVREHADTISPEEARQNPKRGFERIAFGKLASDILPKPIDMEKEKRERASNIIRLPVKDVLRSIKFGKK